MCNLQWHAASNRCDPVHLPLCSLVLSLRDTAPVPSAAWPATKAVASASPSTIWPRPFRAPVVRHCMNRNVSQRHPPSENEHAAKLGGLAAFRRPPISAWKGRRSSGCCRDRRSGARRRSLPRTRRSCGAASKVRQASAVPCRAVPRRWHASRSPQPVRVSPGRTILRCEHVSALRHRRSPCSAHPPPRVRRGVTRSCGIRPRSLSRACGAICRERECLMLRPGN